MLQQHRFCLFSLNKQLPTHHSLLCSWWLLVALCLLCYCGTCRGYLIWLSPGATLLCLLLLAIARHFGRACLMAVLSVVSWWARLSG